MAYTDFNKAVLRSAVVSMLVLAPWAFSAPAQAAATSQVVPLTFTGTVTADPAATIQIRQADGSYVPYTGPVPSNTSYHAGDAVTITMNATLPTRAYFDTMIAAGGSVPADGLYHIKLTSTPNGSTNSATIGYVSPAAVSGGLSSVGLYGEPNYTTLSVVYNYNTDSFSLDGTGSFRDESVRGAGFTYDAASGTVSACTGLSCAPAQASGYGAFSLIGGSDGSITSSMSYLWDAAAEVVGRFTLGLSGTWSLPAAGGGGATQVPEPSMLALFGAGVFVPVLRRRRARAGKVALLSRQSV
jgi:hypothetical protein